MSWLPTARDETKTVATPLPLSVPEPIIVLVVESNKVTLPVGVPLNCGLTVAVKVTVCPNSDGFGDAARPVVVVAWFTTCVIGDDVLPVRLASPL